MGSQAPICFYATGETDNPYYHKLGLLNTGSRIVLGANLNGAEGVHDGNNNPYYQFFIKALKQDRVTFRFEDGGASHSVSLSECKNGSDKKIWK